jgi:alkylation response protein AidB-like acyl-CoA dehydrogenase
MARLVPGTKGISLFIVPKKLVDTDGQLTGERNDVALAGLNHKCGWRGTTNTLLNFGEGKFRPWWARPAPSATWSASPARACAACST